MYNIVYYSKYGHTEEYAKMLAEEFGICALPLKEAKKKFKNQEVIFMTSLSNNKLNKFSDALKLFNIKVICAVGYNYYRDTFIELLNLINMNETIPLFYMQGGVDMTKMGFLDKMMIQTSLAQYQQRNDFTPEELEMFKMFNEPTNCVSHKNLGRVIAYLKGEEYIEEENIDNQSDEEKQE